MKPDNTPTRMIENKTTERHDKVRQPGENDSEGGHRQIRSCHFLQSRLLSDPNVITMWNSYRIQDKTEDNTADTGKFLCILCGQQLLLVISMIWY